MNNKIFSVKVRLSQKERFILEQKSSKSGLTMSAFIRKVIAGSTVHPLPIEEYKQLIKQVNLNGNNINQTVKAIHMGIAQPQDIQYIQMQQSKIYKAIEELAHGIHKDN